MKMSRRCYLPSKKTKKSAAGLVGQVEFAGLVFPSGPLGIAAQRSDTPEKPSPSERFQGPPQLGPCWSGEETP